MSGAERRRRAGPRRAARRFVYESSPPSLPFAGVRRASPAPRRPACAAGSPSRRPPCHDERPRRRAQRAGRAGSGRLPGPSTGPRRLARDGAGSPRSRTAPLRYRGPPTAARRAVLLRWASGSRPGAAREEAPARAARRGRCSCAVCGGRPGAEPAPVSTTRVAAAVVGFAARRPLRRLKKSPPPPASAPRLLHGEPRQANRALPAPPPAAPALPAANACPVSPPR
jgi:hypothetical protein